MEVGISRIRKVVVVEGRENYGRGKRTVKRKGGGRAFCNKSRGRKYEVGRLPYGEVDYGKE